MWTRLLLVGMLMACAGDRLPAQSAEAITPAGDLVAQQAPPRKEPAPRAPAREKPAPAPKSCCKTCKKGKACGNTCISMRETCSKPPGCACDSGAN